ncbi:PEP-CTERM sorting domain-containing protein [Paludisphaera mucosa]|uniref:PEP-CTERM sorting domain-containing protein n=1 Tax=Paludisphaera mucosa TaxID=3030827 RepID=A0ABT6FE21_9BACT|nr:PEP-CTERM sorting domain-containing protein [Paludisphaera mucosa]MDG3005620.1 PEP-CTERM sorting domain-containing protein [Paludisphaera mucosa]
MLKIFRRTLFSLAPAVLALFLADAPCRAGFVVTTTAVVANQGGTGYFEVLLTNDSAPDRTLSAYSIDIQVGPGVWMTSVDDATSVAAFVFGSEGTGTLSFDPLPANFVNVSDLSTSLDGFVTVAANQTVSLGRIGYSVASNAAPGLVPITFVMGPGTMLLSGSGVSYPSSVLSFAPGTFEVVGSGTAVPEPSSVLLSLSGVGLLAAAGWARRKAPTAAARS